jgi:hypothetical protein
MHKNTPQACYYLASIIHDVLKGEVNNLMLIYTKDDGTVSSVAVEGLPYDVIIPQLEEALAKWKRAKEIFGCPTT